MASISQYVADRNGTIIKDPYKKDGVLWVDLKCSKGHLWTPRLENIKYRKTWCPYCGKNIGEELVRSSLCEAFPGYSFEKTRSVKGMKGYELDGFNEKLRIAFEYNGIQHYKYVPHFHRNGVIDFKKQQERDTEREALCIKNWLCLITVPYTIKHINIRSFVRDEIVDMGYEPAPTKISDEKFIELADIDAAKNTAKFNKLLGIIAKKGGMCLTEKYLGYRIPIKIRCKRGHIFNATPEAISQPTSRGPRFCTVCGGTQKQSEKILANRVASCGYKLLKVGSKKVGSQTRRVIDIECPQGHLYSTLWDNFCPQNGTPKKGCTICHHNKLGSLKRKDIAQWCQKNKIQILGQYKNQSTKYNWACAKKHTFIASYSSLSQKKNGPCTACSLEKIQRDKKIAIITKNAHHLLPTVHLEWKCLRCSTIFEATLMAIFRRNKSCQKCP